MAVHRLDPEPGRVVDVFSRDAPPALVIDPGDTVVVRTLDDRGHRQRQRYPGEDRPLMFPARRGHCLAGPIAVRGARPGQMVSVRLDSLRPAEWGRTISLGRDNALNRRAGTVAAESAHLLWTLDPDEGVGVDQHGVRVRLAPFLGVIGTAPAAPGEHSTAPPRPRSGGNIDCKDLVAGSVVTIPVNVPDAYLFVGDGHAAQGDGEVGGSAIECWMTTELTVDLVDDAPVDGVHAVTPTARITFGFDPDLNAAVGEALDAMLTWMQPLFGVDRQSALALASVVVDLRITQVVNQTWGAHASLPHEAVRT